MAGTVLIVDDDPDMLDLFVAILEPEGYRTSVASGVERALTADRSLGGTQGPAVILVDAGLCPDDVGSLGEALSERWPDSSVTCLVDASDDGVRRQVERRRLRHFVRPFQIENLRYLVGDVVRRRAGAER